jgi:hypothetical protein
MRACIDCRKKLGFFERGVRCKTCRVIYEEEQMKARQAEQEEKKQLREEKRRQLADVENYIRTNYDITDEQSKLLKTWDKENLLEVYNRICYSFELTDRELNEQEILVLNKLQDVCGLSNDEIEFDDKIRPYIYAFMIRQKHSLPRVKLDGNDIPVVVLKKDETIHFYDSDVTILKEDRFTETSRGHLIITNGRLFLNPALGFKPVSITLNKILSYSAYDNGLEVYQERREKSYFFEMKKSGSVKLARLCLTFLLGHNE